MSKLQMRLVHSFGSSCSQKYHNAVSICDQDINEPKVVFPTGKSIAKKHIDRPQMDFVHFSDDAGSISEILILPTRKHIATVEKPIGSNKDIIRIYNMQKPSNKYNIKIFHDSDQQGTVKLIAFANSEPNFLCCLVGQPHFKLIFIDTNRNKPLAQSNFSQRQLQQISICPNNSHLICGSGGNNLVFYRVQEYAFKPLDEIKRIPKGRKFTQHAWYKKKMVMVATDRCELLILQQTKHNQFEVKMQYTNAFNDQHPQNTLTWISAICCFSKGFVVGSNTGYFCLWNNRESVGKDDLILEPVRKWSTTEERSAQVTCIAISLKQDLIVVSMSNNDVAMLSLVDMMPQMINKNSQRGLRQINFNYLYKGFHNAQITAMDICIQRPLIATCSKQDSTIRVWNYKNYGCQLLRMFYFRVKSENVQHDSQQPLNTLCLHPCGYYMAVGCSDKLRFFHILNNQLRPYRQLPLRNVYNAKFSHGGHLLAVVLHSGMDSDLQHIKVLDALTLRQVVTFKDHFSPITSLEWKMQDQCLCSISQKGCLFEWRVSDWCPVKTITDQKTNNSCMTYCNHRKSIITYGNYGGKHLLKQIAENGQNLQLQVDMKVVIMKQIKTTQAQGLLLGLQNGSVVIFGGIHKPIIIQHYNDNLAAITNVVISPYNDYLITSGSDSLIFIYQLCSLIEGNLQPQSTLNNTVDDFLADVVLINKKEVSEYYNKQQQLYKTTNTLQNKLQQISLETGKKNEQKIREILIQKQRIIDDVNYYIKRLQEQIQQLNKQDQAAIDELDNDNFKEASQLQRVYEQKLQFEDEKYFQLQQQIIQIKLLHKQELQQIQRQEQAQIQQLKAQIKDKFKESQHTFSDSKNIQKKSTQIFEKRLKQIEQQQQEEIRQLENKNQQIKTQSQVILAQLQEKELKIKKQHLKLCQQRDQLKKEYEQGVHGKRKIDKEVEESREKYKDMHKEHQDKISTLQSKETKIIAFESKIQDLQKKKHILSYKATEMMKAIEPKEQQIEKLKLDLIKLKKQFELALEKKQRGVLLMEKIEKERRHLEKNLQSEIVQTTKQTTLLDSIISQLHIYFAKGIQGNKDPRKAEKLIVKLYHKYVEKNHKVIGQNNSKGIEEITKQITHLEKSYFQINRTGQKHILRKNNEIDKKIKENAELLNNLNQIKKENKELGLKYKSKKEQITKLRTLKSDILAECQKVDTNAYKKFIQQQPITLKTPTKKMAESTIKMKQDESKQNYKKKQCEILSQFQFVKQKIHKYEFIIKDLTDKYALHYKHFRCQGSPMGVIQDMGQKQ